MTALYQIATEYRIALNESFVDDELAMLDQVNKLNSLNDDIENKAVNIAAYIKNLEIESENVKAAIKEMQERAKRLENRAENLSNYLKLNLESCGVLEVRKSPHFLIKIKTNPPSVVIEDENLISDEYKKVKHVITIDKTAIKKDMANGVIIEGARIETRTRIEIK